LKKGKILKIKEKMGDTIFFSLKISDFLTLIVDFFGKIVTLYCYVLLSKKP